MIDEQKKAILKQAFSVLKPEHIENFRWHLQNETPVICGEPAYDLAYFEDNDSG